MGDAVADARPKGPLDRGGRQRFRAEVIGRKNLPTIPAVLSQVLGLVEREDSSTRDLVDLIEHDQALTGKMLRLANSAFFGQSRRVATIPRAVMLLGFSTARSSDSRAGSRRFPAPSCCSASRRSGTSRSG